MAQDPASYKGTVLQGPQYDPIAKMDAYFEARKTKRKAERDKALESGQLPELNYWAQEDQQKIRELQQEYLTGYGEAVGNFERGGDNPGDLSTTTGRYYTAKKQELIDLALLSQQDQAEWEKAQAVWQQNPTKYWELGHRMKEFASAPLGERGHIDVAEYIPWSATWDELAKAVHEDQWQEDTKIDDRTVHTKTYKIRPRAKVYQNFLNNYNNSEITRDMVKKRVDEYSPFFRKQLEAEMEDDQEFTGSNIYEYQLWKESETRSWDVEGSKLSMRSAGNSFTMGSGRQVRGATSYVSSASGIFNGNPELRQEMAFDKGKWHKVMIGRPGGTPPPLPYSTAIYPIMNKFIRDPANKKWKNGKDFTPGVDTGNGTPFSDNLLNHVLDPQYYRSPFNGKTIGYSKKGDKINFEGVFHVPAMGDDGWFYQTVTGRTTAFHKTSPKTFLSDIIIPMMDNESEISEVDMVEILNGMGIEIVNGEYDIRDIMGYYTEAERIRNLPGNKSYNKNRSKKPSINVKNYQ